jgi:hypothetical protein
MDLGHTFYLLIFEKVGDKSIRVIIALFRALDLVSAAAPQLDYSPGGSFFNLTRNKNLGGDVTRRQAIFIRTATGPQHDDLPPNLDVYHAVNCKLQNRFPVLIFSR